MKKICALLLCLLLLAFMLPLSALAGDYLVVNNPIPTDRLHLREKPDEKSFSLGKYYNGTKVAFLKDMGNGWYKVDVGSVGLETGGSSLYGFYMKKQYLASGSAADAVVSAMPRYVSTSSSWDLYSSIAVDGQGRYYLDKNSGSTQGAGVEIELMGFTPDWWHIRLVESGLTGFVPAHSPQFKEPQFVTVLNPNPSDRLHLRVNPSKSAASQGKYYSGVKGMILGYAGNNQWVAVRIGILTGYMDARYIVTDAKAQAKIKSLCPRVQVKNPAGTQHLNLRELPSETSASLGLYATGTSVKVLGVGPTWYHVEVNGVTGFMMAKFLDPKLPQ